MDKQCDVVHLSTRVPNRIASASSAALSHTDESSSHHPPRARSTHARTHATSRRYSSFSIASIDHFTGARATSRFSSDDDDDRSRGCRARESGSRATTTRRRARRTARVGDEPRGCRWRGKISTRRYETNDGLTETLARSLFHHLHQTTNQAQPVSAQDAEHAIGVRVHVHSRPHGSRRYRCRHRIRREHDDDANGGRGNAAKDGGRGQRQGDGDARARARIRRIRKLSEPRFRSLFRLLL